MLFFVQGSVTRLQRVLFPVSTFLLYFVLEFGKHPSKKEPPDMDGQVHCNKDAKTKVCL